MRFGLSLPHYGFSLPDGDIDYRAAADMALKAESLGFDSVWVSDHFFYSFARYGGSGRPIAALEPMTLLAGLAAQTSRVELGTLVLCDEFRHPSVLAKSAATLDALSSGRFTLGLGAGWLEEEFTAFGYQMGSVKERFDRLEETLRVLAALRSGEAVTIDGRFPLRDAVLLPRSAAPGGRFPVTVGGKGGPRLLRLAAQLADGWNVVWRVEPSSYVEKVRALRERCELEGRDPSEVRLSVGLYALPGQTEEEAAGWFEVGKEGFPGGAMSGDTWESWRADTLSGSPDQILERIAAFEEIGVDEIIIAPWVLPFAIPHAELVDLFAERVMSVVKQ